MEINKIYQGDCLELMNQLEDNSIDLVVTSPPYDNLREYKGYTFNFEGIAKELVRIIKEGGVIVWIVGDATINGSETGTSFRHALYFKEIGFNLHDTMIWEKKDPIPQVKQPRYWNCFEYMFVFSKGKIKTFNPLKVKCVTAGRSRKGTLKQITKDKERKYKEWITSDERKEKNIWRIATSRDTKGHPAVFPDQLAKDHITSWSNEGDIVLDIMCGSGTTCKMALKNNRKFLGFEISEEYCKIANERLLKELSSPKEKS